jgi:hypothetical protein
MTIQTPSEEGAKGIDEAWKRFIQLLIKLQKGSSGVKFTQLNYGLVAY